MSVRPKRARKVPERYGFDGNAAAIVEDDEFEQLIACSSPAKKVKKEEIIEYEVGVTPTKPTQARIKQESFEISSPDPYQCQAPIPSLPTSPTAILQSQPVSYLPTPRKPGPNRTITSTTAKKNYKLTDKDLSGLKCRTEENPHSPFYAPMRLYKAIDCWNLAIKKHGSPDDLAEALEKSRSRGNKIKATRAANAQHKAEAERRTRDIRPILQQANIPLKYLTCDKELVRYISKNDGDLAEIVIRLKKVAEEERALHAVRKHHLRTALEQRDLPGADCELLSFSNYIETGQGLEELLDMHAAALAAKRARDQRMRDVQVMLQYRGLPPVTDASLGFYFHTYLVTGTQAALDTGLQSYQRFFETQKLEQERTTKVTCRLQAEGILQKYSKSADFQQYIHSGLEYLFEKGLESARRLHSLEVGRKQQTRVDNQQRVCCVQGCTLLHAFTCTGKVCGKHKALCKDPRCKKHGTPWLTA